MKADGRTGGSNPLSSLLPPPSHNPSQTVHCHRQLIALPTTALSSLFTHTHFFLFSLSFIQMFNPLTSPPFTQHENTSLYSPVGHLHVPRRAPPRPHALPPTTHRPTGRASLISGPLSPEIRFPPPPWTRTSPIS